MFNNVSSTIDPTHYVPVVINLPTHDDSNNLGQISVLVSSVLLSAAGFLTMLIGSLNKSRCVKMSCGCSECTRAVLDDPVV
jgi:hypothetical protein